MEFDTNEQYCLSDDMLVTIGELVNILEVIGSAPDLPEPDGDDPEPVF